MEWYAVSSTNRRQNAIGGCSRSAEESELKMIRSRVSALVAALGMGLLAPGCAHETARLGHTAFRAEPTVYEGRLDSARMAVSSSVGTVWASDDPIVPALTPAGLSAPVEQRPGAAKDQKPERIALPPDPEPLASPLKSPQDRQNAPSSTNPPESPDSGAAISLHADNLDVRKVLEVVSRQAKMNILVSPGVSGTVTLDLGGKTVDETLRTLAKLCRLTVQREKDVLYVSTPDEMRKGEEDNMPVRVYHLNYVRSSDVEKMVKPLLSKKGMFTASPECEIGLASDAAQAGDKAKEVKAGGNLMAGGEIVVVQDYEQVLKTVDRVIAQIDVQPVQVLIEAVIVSVKLEKGMELGVNFALLDGAGRALSVLGDGGAINAAAGFTPASVLAAGNTGLLKGTPISGSAEVVPGLRFGFVDKSTTGFIRALETLGETKVLACPRLLVLNKQRAEIHLGDRLGYATSTQTQTSTIQKVEFQDVGTQLRLRPFVSSDGMVRMEIRPERSSGKIEAGIPQVNAAQVTTNVMVPDGATIVIGGLIESEVQHGWAGVPLLSRLPWIGYLFRETIDNTTKRELVVILTPHIWRPKAPEALNYLGRPRSLGLDARVSQRPCEEARDGPSLYELPPPAVCPQGDPPANMLPLGP